MDGLMGPAKKFGLYSLGSGDPLRNLSKGETLVRLPFFFSSKTYAYSSKRVEDGDD